MRRYALHITLLLFISACDEEPRDSPDLSAEDTLVSDAQDSAVDLRDAEADTAPPPPLPGLSLTINAIPTSMNGSRPFSSDVITEPTPYRYTVPRHGFTLDVLADGPTELETLSLSCDRGSGEGPTRTEAGEALAAEFVQEGSRVWRWYVPEERAFDVGAALCTAEVEDVHGQRSEPFSYAFDVAELTPERDPFVEIDPWLIVTSRDLWTVDAPTTNPDGTLTIPITQTPNGVPDFTEDLLAVGIMSAPDDPASLYVRALLERRLLELARAWFLQGEDGSITSESIRIRLHFEGDLGAPSPGDPGVSLMALGGSDGRRPGDPINGRARIDWNNQRADDNTAADLGVFTSAMFARVVAFSVGVNALGPILPGVGAPIGTHPADATVWRDDFDRRSSTDEAANARYDAVTQIINLGGLALASVLVHEIGHSLGLVPYGLPPEGLFAEVGLADFMASQATDAHIDTQGLNIMQQGNAIENDIAPLLLGAQPAFSPPALAYLQRRIIVYPE